MGNNAQQKSVKQASKVSRAIQMRTAGASYQAIANELGYANRASAYKCVWKELQAIAVEDVDTLRKTQLLALDTIQQKLWITAFPVGKSTNLAAVDRLLAVLAQRAKLMGLNAETMEMPVTQVIVREIPANYMTGPPEPVIIQSE